MFVCFAALPSKALAFVVFCASLVLVFTTFSASSVLFPQKTFKRKNAVIYIFSGSSAIAKLPEQVGAAKSARHKVGSCQCLTSLSDATSIAPNSNLRVSKTLASQHRSTMELKDGRGLRQTAANA